MLVQLPVRMRRALKLFRKITGLTAVTSLAPTFPGDGEAFALSPPVHPQCAKRLRSVRVPPCSGQWMIHVRSGRRSRREHTHTCPIGLRCSCVPIHLGDQFIGVAKLVVDSETSEPALTAAVSILKLVVSETCQDAAVAMLSGELRESRRRLTELRQVRSSAEPKGEGAQGHGTVLVDRALAHLQRHYDEPTLSLQDVAAALACNPRYLTTRFSKIVGERMHSYLIALRVSHACRLLMDTELPVKEVAFASGFSGAGRMDGAFRRHVGVPPTEYRRVFASP